LGLDDDVVWRASSGILTAFSLAFVLGWVLSSRRFFNVAREIFSVPAFSLMTIGHLINLVSQLSVTLGMWGGGKTGVYLLGLLWLLAHASQQFVRMLFVQPRPVGSSTDI